MYKELKDDVIIRKVGGRFKLTTLIQKRLVFLNRGAAPLVDINSKDKMEIVIEEIMQDKIYLDMDNELRIAGQDDFTAPGM